MTKTLDRTVLDKLECTEPGCTCDDSVLFLYPTCHPNYPTRARYEKQQGELVIACSACRKEVIRILVASGNHDQDLDSQSQYSVQ